MQKTEPLSASTLNSYHRMLSSILTGAVRDGHIGENPCRKAEPPKVPQAEANIMQPEETQRLIAALASESLVWQSLIMAYIYTGARTGLDCSAWCMVLRARAMEGCCG